MASIYFLNLIFLYLVFLHLLLSSSGGGGGVGREGRSREIESKEGPLLRD